MLFSETEPAVSDCGETIWKEPKLCCRSARRRGRRRRPGRACLIWFESIGCFLHSSLRRKNSPVVPKGFAIFSGYLIKILLGRHCSIDSCRGGSAASGGSSGGLARRIVRLWDP
ncbi:hypothetical protein DY000_02057688 [Brassica cretica]|uniref:Uncharacterized protein n=1 Tax=Brassica cretica TaxID=69181 RepID=A0ABQ7ALR7_BRACR|nr:hypothetical protein DY000_02057688 [Brassica cretica]